MSISVIIPTLNEACTIEGLVKFIHGHGPTVAEIIVVDGGSTDETVVIARKAGAVVFQSVIKSRAAQMNLGAKIATGEILYFVHADVRLVQGFCEDIDQAVKAGYKAGCYRFVFDSSDFMLKLNAYCTRYKGIMCRGGDQTLFITKSLFRELNGFDEYFTIMEDYDLIQRIWSKAKFKVIPRDVIVSSRKYKTNSWLRVQFANVSVFMLYFLKRNPAQIKSFYIKTLNYR